MTKQRKSQARDALILAHVARYRLTTLSALQRAVLPELSRNALNKIASRLCESGLLQKHNLFYPQNYFVLGAEAIRSLGLGIHRAAPLGPQSLPQEFAVLAFATLGKHQHLRLNAVEVKERCSWMPLSLATVPHCLDESNVLEFIRVDLGGPPDHVARKCAADLTERGRVPEFLTLVAAAQFRLVIITTTVEKVGAIQRALQHHLWPPGLMVHFSVVPQLLSIGATVSHA